MLSRAEIYRKIFNDCGAMMLLVDPWTTAIVEANPAACRFYGYSHEELLKRRVTDIDILPPSEVHLQVQRAWRGEADCFTCRHRLASDEIRDVEVRCCPVRLDGKEFIFAVNQDVTERCRAEQARRESEEQLRHFVALSPDYLFKQDRDLRYVWNSNRPTRGLSIVGITDNELFPVAEEAALVISLKRKVMETGKGVRRTIRVHLHGRVNYFDAVYEPWRDPSGEVCGIFGYARDITELQRAKSRLEEGEVRLQAIVSQLSDGLFMIDERGVITDWNLALERITGIPRAAIVGKPFPDMHDPENAAAVRMLKRQADELMRCEGPAAPRSATGLMRSMDGKRKEIQFSLFRVNYARHKLVGITVRDVSEFCEISEALRMTRQTYETVVNNINLGVVLINGKREIVGMNRQLLEWFPATRKGTPRCKACFNPSEDGGNCSACPVQRCFEDGLVHEHVASLDRDGGTRYFRLITSPVKDPDGGVSSVVKIYEDCTEAIKAEEEVRHYQEKLRALSLEASLGEERERRRISTYLHDTVAQSLAVALLRLETLRKAPDPRQAREAVDAIAKDLEESILRVRSMTFDLSVPLLYELGFGAAVEWLADETERQYGIRCEVTHDGTSPDNEVRVILFRAVRELLMNIVKHARARRVAIRISGDGGRIRVSVSDDGVGFDTGSAGSRAGGLSGFGLFSIREQMANMRGECSIDSRVGGGTTVVLAAPLRLREKLQTTGRNNEDHHSDR